MRKGTMMLAPERTFDGFKVVESVAGPEFFTDFLGTKTRVSYLPESCQWLAGKSFGFPSPGNLILYEFEEWRGVMGAVREAENAFTCIELGAGWAPWLVASSHAAMQRGINDLYLIGVEADQNNILNMESHFRDNGLTNSYHRFIHAAIDDHDAEASEQHPAGAPLLSLYSLLNSCRTVNLY
jgi:hypothetical protein